MLIVSLLVLAEVVDDICSLILQRRNDYLYFGGFLAVLLTFKGHYLKLILFLKDLQDVFEVVKGNNLSKHLFQFVVLLVQVFELG